MTHTNCGVKMEIFSYPSILQVTYVLSVAFRRFFWVPIAIVMVENYFLVRTLKILLTKGLLYWHIIAKFCKKKKYVWKGNVTVTDHRPTHGTARKRHRTITATQKVITFAGIGVTQKWKLNVFFYYLETLFFLIVHPIILVSDLTIITVLVVLCLSPAEGK